MKPVGIITQFHNSLNYGGVLQACALCRVLAQLDIPSEQIRCVFYGEAEKRNWKQALKKLLPGMVVEKLRSMTVREEPRQENTRRREAFEAFNAAHVPSSSRVYTTYNASECVSGYRAFITGSDQMWNPDWYCRTMFLDFVPSRIPKLSYAASIGKSSLTPEQQEKFRMHLKDFQAVSVREADAVPLVAPLSPVPVECLLDPTLVLTADQWDAVCAPPQVEGEYLFCYFLGADEEALGLMGEYAARHHLKIAGIPNADANSGQEQGIAYDVALPDASPAEFLSLVKYAKCVFTDSFHATVFSGVFGRNHFVFPRAGHEGMSGRISNVTALFETRERFCNTSEKKTLSYVEGLPSLDPSRPLPELERMRRASLDYLKRNLMEPSQEHR